MNLRQSLLSSLIALPLVLQTPLLHATPVTGQANIAGNVTVQDGSITFSPTFTSTTGAMETGAFSGLTGGTIQSLTGGPTTGNLATPIVNFVNFSGGTAAPVSFDLTYIAPGVGTLAGCSSSTPGAACTPTGSPFTLVQLTSNTIIATFQVNGISYTGSSSTGSSPTTVVLTTQSVVSGTLPDIYALLASGGAISSTYSASFVATPGPSVPEPASMALLGLGLAGAGLLARRKGLR